MKEHKQSETPQPSELQVAHAELCGAVYVALQVFEGDDALVEGEPAVERLRAAYERAAGEGRALNEALCDLERAFTPWGEGALERAAGGVQPTEAPELVACSGCGEGCYDYQQRGGGRYCICCVVSDAPHLPVGGPRELFMGDEERPEAASTTTDITAAQDMEARR